MSDPLLLLGRDTLCICFDNLNLFEVLSLRRLSKDWKYYLEGNVSNYWVKRSWVFVLERIESGFFLNLPSYVKIAVKPKLLEQQFATIYTFGMLWNNPDEAKGYFGWFDRRNCMDTIINVVRQERKSVESNLKGKYDKAYIRNPLKFKGLPDNKIFPSIRTFVRGLIKLLIDIPDKTLKQVITETEKEANIIYSTFEKHRESFFTKRQSDGVLLMYIMSKGTLCKAQMEFFLSKETYSFDLLESLGIVRDFIPTIIKHYKPLPKRFFESLSVHNTLHSSKENLYDYLGTGYDLKQFPSEWIKKMRPMTLALNKVTDPTFLVKSIYYHPSIAEPKDKLSFQIFLEKNIDDLNQEFITLWYNFPQEKPTCNYLEDDEFSFDYESGSSEVEEELDQEP